LPVFAVHVPVAQVKQLPVQAVSQQWPSAEQVPLAHSCWLPQVPPGAFLATHVEPLQ
jgi:hypothetical protein